jgi:hypothetical protein
VRRAIVVRGRLINLSTIELDEPVSELTGDVEIVLRDVAAEDQTAKSETMFEFLRRLPVGTRTKEDIEQQIGGSATPGKPTSAALPRCKHDH